jgi:hypothetical protein
MKSFSFTDRRPSSHGAYNHLCYGIRHCSYLNGRSGRLTHSITAWSSRTKDRCDNYRIPVFCTSQHSPQQSSTTIMLSLIFSTAVLPATRILAAPVTSPNFANIPAGYVSGFKTQASNPQPEAKPSAYQALWTSPHPRPTSRSNTPSPPTKPHSPS